MRAAGPAQILSNDVYKAANHRVVLAKNGKSRYSFPVFFNPRVDAVLKPLPDFVTPERPAAYRPVRPAGVELAMRASQLRNAFKHCAQALPRTLWADAPPLALCGSCTVLCSP